MKSFFAGLFYWLCRSDARPLLASVFSFTVDVASAVNASTLTPLPNLLNPADPLSVLGRSGRVP